MEMLLGEDIVNPEEEFSFEVCDLLGAALEPLDSDLNPEIMVLTEGVNIP